MGTGATGAPWADVAVAAARKAITALSHGIGQRPEQKQIRTVLDLAHGIVKNGPSELAVKAIERKIGSLPDDLQPHAQAIVDAARGTKTLVDLSKIMVKTIGIEEKTGKTIKNHPATAKDAIAAVDQDISIARALLACLS